MKRIKLLGLFSIMLFTVLVQSKAYSQLNILSGTEGGTYFNLANDLAKISSQPINVIPSSGSMENFHQLSENPEMMLAFMQYDVLLANELINPSVRKDYQVLFPFFLDEEIHLITRKDSKIASLDDLKGKKVGIGTSEEGTRVTAQTIKNKTQIAWKDSEIPTSMAYDALMKGEIDAYFYVVGIPANGLSDLAADANIKLVNITHKNLKDVYTKKVIPVGTYKWQTKEVSTFAVPTILVVKFKELNLENEKKINTFLTEIKESIPKLQQEGHPKWKAVYFKNQEINWTYYYMRSKVE